ncbi:MAG: DUF5658 family protein [Acidimicrobiales bacterium]
MSILAIADVADTDHGARLRVATAVAVAAVAVFNLLDIVTTRTLLARGAIESNPLAGLLLQGGGVEIAKLALVAGLAWRVARRRPSVAFAAAVWFVAGFYFLTVVSNLLILSRIS